LVDWGPVDPRGSSLSHAFDRPVLQIACDFLMASGEITNQQAAEHLSETTIVLGPGRDSLADRGIDATHNLGSPGRMTDPKYPVTYLFVIIIRGSRRAAPIVWPQVVSVVAPLTVLSVVSALPVVAILASSRRVAVLCNNSAAPSAELLTISP
jgi:hypothetical protein